jgi:hypothetical protein
VGPVQPGLVVFVRFPFSDLSASKLRPAVVLAQAWCRLDPLPGHEQPLRRQRSRRSGHDILRFRRARARELREAKQAVHGKSVPVRPDSRAASVHVSSRARRASRGSPSSWSAMRPQNKELKLTKPGELRSFAA